MMRLLPALCLVACSAGGSGIAVGNPGKLDASVEELPPDLEADEAWLAVESVRLTPCGGGQAEVLVPEVFDLLRDDPVEHPGGQWCEIEVFPIEEDALVVIGTDGQGEPVERVWSLEPFALQGSYTVDDSDVLLVVALDAVGKPPPVEPVTLYVEVDGLFVQSGGEPVDQRTDVGCGCRASGGPGPWGLSLGMLGWLAVWWRRRRPG